MHERLLCGSGYSHSVFVIIHSKTSDASGPNPPKMRDLAETGCRLARGVTDAACVRQFFRWGDTQDGGVRMSRPSRRGMRVMPAWRGTFIVPAEAGGIIQPGAADATSASLRRHNRRGTLVVPAESQWRSQPIKRGHPSSRLARIAMS